MNICICTSKYVSHPFVCSDCDQVCSTSFRINTLNSAQSAHCKHINMSTHTYVHPYKVHKQYTIRTCTYTQPHPHTYVYVYTHTNTHTLTNTHHTVDSHLAAVPRWYWQDVEPPTWHPPVVAVKRGEGRGGGRGGEGRRGEERRGEERRGEERRGEERKGVKWMGVLHTLTSTGAEATG